MKKLISLFAENGAGAMLALILILFAAAIILLINPPVLMTLLRLAAAALCIAAGIWLTIAFIHYLFMQ